MIFYNYFLKVCGLRGLIGASMSPNTDNELKEIKIIIDENGEVQNDIVKQQKPFHKKKLFRHIINNIYRLCIILILSFECVYPIVRAGIDANVRHFTASFFSYMYLVQYIFGIIFYSDDYGNKYYDKTMQKLKEYNQYVFVSYIVGFVIALVLSLFSVAFVAYESGIGTYGQLYAESNTVGKVILLVYICVNRFYSYNICVVNAVTFAAILCVQSISIKNYNTRLAETIDENIIELDINLTIQEFTELKCYYDESIDKFNNIFGSILVCGMLGCYFTIINHNYDMVTIFTYIDIVYYVVIQATYIITLGIIKRAVDNIKKLTSSVKFTTLILSKSDFAEVHGLSTDRLQKSPSLISNSNMLTSRSPRKLQDRVIVDSGSCQDGDKKIDMIKNISIRSMIISNENGACLDWIILDKKLSDPWNSFVVLGFEISDSVMIQQLMSIAFGFLGLLQISKLI